jgi:hypothetical protein
MAHGKDSEPGPTKYSMHTQRTRRARHGNGGARLRGTRRSGSRVRCRCASRETFRMLPTGSHARAAPRGRVRAAAPGPAFVCGGLSAGNAGKARQGCAAASQPPQKEWVGGPDASSSHRRLRQWGFRRSRGTLISTGRASCFHIGGALAMSGHRAMSSRRDVMGSVGWGH